MATTTFGALKTKTLSLSDLLDYNGASTGYITNDRLNIIVNDAYRSAYDRIIEAGFEDYYTTSIELVSDASGSLSLPNDFYKLRGLDLKITSNDYIEVSRGNFLDRNNTSYTTYPRYNNKTYWLVQDKLNVYPPQANETYRLFYIPEVAELVNDNDTTVDLLSCRDYPAVVAACELLVIQEKSNNELLKMKMEAEKHIQTMAARRDASGPRKLPIVRNRRYNRFGRYAR